LQKSFFRDKKIFSTNEDFVLPLSFTPPPPPLKVPPSRKPQGRTTVKDRYLPDAVFLLDVGPKISC